MLDLNCKSDGLVSRTEFRDMPDLAIGDGDHRRYFPANGGHYNGEGYRVVSEQVIALIREDLNSQL